MKAASIATMFLITLSTAARGQTEGIAQFTGQTRLGDRTLPSHVRVLVRGGTSRIEVEMNLKGSASRRPAGNPGIPTSARLVMITKSSEPKKLYILNDQRRSFAVLDASTARQSRKGDAIDTKKLGRDTVRGLLCEKALVTFPESE